jgi:hypothetical protein
MPNGALLVDERENRQASSEDEGVRITPYLPYAPLPPLNSAAGDSKLDEVPPVGKRWVLITAWVSFALALLNPAITYAIYLIGSLIDGDFFRYYCGLRTTVTALPIIALVAMFLAVISANKRQETHHQRLIAVLGTLTFILGLLALLTAAYLAPLLNLFGKTICLAVAFRKELI